MEYCQFKNSKPRNNEIEVVKNSYFGEVSVMYDLYEIYTFFFKKWVEGSTVEGENLQELIVFSSWRKCYMEGVVVHPYHFLFVWSHCALMGKMLAEVLVTQCQFPPFHQNLSIRMFTVS